jgi:hypothetical protein
MQIGHTPSKCDWWNSQSGKFLASLIKSSGLEAKDLLAAVSSADHNLLAGWLTGDDSPETTQFERLCARLSLNPALFRDASRGRSSPVPQSVTITLGHPHEFLVSTLTRRLSEGGAPSLEFLAPHGFLRTSVLQELRSVLPGFVAFVPASLVDNLDQFWTTLAQELKRAGLPVVVTEGDFWCVYNAVQGQSCTIVVDDADLLLIAAAEHGDIEKCRLWITRLRDLNCSVVVAGALGLDDLLSSIYTVPSKHPFERIDSPLCDAWDGWTEWVFYQRSVPKEIAGDIRSLSMGYPAAVLHATAMFRSASRERLPDVIHRYLISAGQIMFNRLPLSLQQSLRHRGLLNLESPARDALFRAGFYATTAPYAQLLALWGTAWRSTSPEFAPYREQQSARGTGGRI